MPEGMRHPINSRTALIVPPRNAVFCTEKRADKKRFAMVRAIDPDRGFTLRCSTKSCEGQAEPKQNFNRGFTRMDADKGKDRLKF
jgi:hypothetical protein